MAKHKRRARSPFIPELLLEPPDELSLLLDEEVSSQDSILERIFLVVRSGLVTRLSPCGLRTWLGDRSVTLPGVLFVVALALGGPFAISGFWRHRAYKLFVQFPTDGAKL